MIDIVRTNGNGLDSGCRIHRRTAQISPLPDELDNDVGIGRACHRTLGGAATQALDIAARPQLVERANQIIQHLVRMERGWGKP